MTPVHDFDSTNNEAVEDTSECHEFGGALFLLSRKLLMLNAIVQRTGWTGNTLHDKEASNGMTTANLLALCISRIVAISKMPESPLQEITQELLDVYEPPYYRGKSSPAVNHHSPLTRREVDVVRLLAEGKCNKEIAAVLHLSVKTVETYRTRIMPKMGAHSLSDVTRFAVRHGIIRIV